MGHCWTWKQRLHTWNSVGKDSFYFSTIKPRLFDTEASCWTVPEVTSLKEKHAGERQHVHLVSRLSACRQWMSLIPRLSEAESGWPACSEQRLRPLKGSFVDKSQEQNSRSCLQPRSPEMLQEQNCCSSHAKCGWEGDSLQIGKGTFLLKRPENHWVRTNPSGTTAETCHKETALPWDQTHKLEKVLSEDWWSSETVFLSRKWCDVSLYACCLHLALIRFMGGSASLPKKTW